MINNKTAKQESDRERSAALRLKYIEKDAEFALLLADQCGCTFNQAIELMKLEKLSKIVNAIAVSNQINDLIFD